MAWSLLSFSSSGEYDRHSLHESVSTLSWCRLFLDMREGSGNLESCQFRSFSRRRQINLCLTGLNPAIECPPWH